MNTNHELYDSTLLVNFFYEMGVMRTIMRSYHHHVRVDTESLAEHHHRVAVIAYVLAKALKADTSKVLLMALFHDVAETRTGDSEWVQKPYVNQDEDLAVARQLEPLGDLTEEVRNVIVEYRARVTLESQIAKDADNIDYILSLKELELTGNQEAYRRLHSENTSGDKLYTDLAKIIADKAKETNPSLWTLADLKTSFEKYEKQVRSAKTISK